MELLKTGREPTKIEVECSHCGARYKVDQRHVVIRWVNVTDRQAVVMSQCKHCINPYFLSRRQQEDLGINADLLGNYWLLQLASLAERGKREFQINDEGDFIAHFGSKLSPTVPLQGATPPQSPPPSETESPGSFEVPE